MVNLILGSSSQFRKQVFQSWFPNTQISTLSPEIDEKAIRIDNPEKLVIAIANAKADALVKKVENQDCLLITADQVIRYKTTIREKPESEQEAAEFIESYAEAPAETVSGVVVTNPKTGKRTAGVDIAKVYFSKIPKDVISKLVKKKDTIMQCAGAFDIDDPDMKPFITKIEGTRDSILGLPKEMTVKLIAEHGVKL